eukprot:5825475-Alexandrium_andersonii.AAC.1
MGTRRRRTRGLTSSWAAHILSFCPCRALCDGEHRRAVRVAPRPTAALRRRSDSPSHAHLASAG